MSRDHRSRRIAYGVAAALAVTATYSSQPISNVAAAGPETIIVDVSTDTTGACPSAVPTAPTCSLRSAIALANANPGSTVMLTKLAYTIANPITISGAGTTLVGATLSGDDLATQYPITTTGKQGFIINASDVTIRGVKISGAARTNTNGGAIAVSSQAQRFMLDSSSIENNVAREGAGVFVAGSAVITGSTFVANRADRKGGAVRVLGTLELLNSTFTENTAQSGGAISVAGSAAISFSTFVDNTSNNQKGGGVDRNGGNLFVTGSILTRANQQSTDGSDCSGNPNLIGPNYVGNAQGCQPGAKTLVGTVAGPAGVGAIGDFGGPTRTIPLLDNSVVLDRADEADCREIGLEGVLDTNDPKVETDQRGIARPFGTGCDLGAFELTPLQLDLELSSSTSTPFVGAQFLPSSAISGSVVETDALFGGSLDASPLNAFPLESAPLNAFPLNAFPLNAFPLNAFPLNAFFTAAAPLNAFPLNAFPLNAFPLNAFPLSELVLTEGSWDELLVNTKFEGVPLQSLTLDDVSGVPAVQQVSVGELNLEGTPLSAFPLSAFLLGSIPLNAFPLNAFGSEVANWCDLVPEFCAAGNVDPSDPRYTLASVALAGVPLNAFPLNAFPLNAFPLNAFPLNAFPLNAFPLNAFAWQSSPLNAFPLNAFPLNAFDAKTVIDCTKLSGGCDGKTLGDAFAAQAFVNGATLGALGQLFLANPNAYNELAGYSAADLVAGLIPSESIPWNEVDLTVPGIQNAGPTDKWTFQYLADLALTGNASELTVDVTIPPGFAYVPGGSQLDGAAIGDPVLSCPGGSCVDSNGDPTPITLTYRLNNVAAGDRRLSIDTRAGFELGTFTATANAEAMSTPGGPSVTAGPATKDVTVIAPQQEPNKPTVIETNGTCTSDGSGDVNLGWVAPSTDGIDLYKFEITNEAALCGVRADIFLSNLPADYDVVLYGKKSLPLRGVPTESIAYLDDVTLDLNPFDDIVQADTVQDIPQVLIADGVNSNDYAVAAISSNRDRGNERIRTGTLRAGFYYIQVTGYNGAEANTPYALRLRTDTTVSRPECAALPYPGVNGVTPIAPLTMPAVGSLPDNLNTLFITNSQLLTHTYGSQAAAVLDAASDVAAAAGSGVIGTILPVDADAAVQAAYEARAADPCDPEKSNDVVRAIGEVIDTYVVARPGIEYIVIIGDDRQVPMANIVDDANFANERTFSQDFTGNNESIAALAAGMYRSDDPYGSSAGIRIRDHELFVPERAVGRLVETPTEIIGALENFIHFDGRLDPSTASQRTALQTGYEFLTDGAQLNAANLEAAGYTVDDALISAVWTDDSLIDKLDDGQIDVVGIHAHFDENNALPAFDNFNPQPTDAGLFDTTELPDAVNRSIVYSMGCHSGYSVSDVQVGAPAADWAQELANGRTTVFGGNTGYGYGDTDRVALTEMLTAIFADEVGQDGSIGLAWAAAKQRMMSELLVLDAYQEKALQQFVLYGLPMFHVGTPPPALTPTAPVVNARLAAPAAASAVGPDIDPITGQPITEVEFNRNLPIPDAPDVPQFDLIDTPDGSYYEVDEEGDEIGIADGRTLTVNGHPIQPLYAADVPSFTGLQARDALITELTTQDAPIPFDPVFFWASPNYGGPRPEYFDGSFPAEMSNVRRYKIRGEQYEQVLVAAGQYRASDENADEGTQRLHTRVVTEVYYSNSNDFDPPAIASSTGAFDNDAVQFDVDVDSSAKRVYVLYRASGVNQWSGVDLAKIANGTWRGVGPFDPGQDTKVEYIIQAVDDAGNVAMSNSKSRYFLASTPGDVSNLTLAAQPTATGSLTNGWYSGGVVVTANGGGTMIQYRIDAGQFQNYSSAVTLNDTAIPSAPGAAIVDTGSHIVSAFDETGAFAALQLKIDSFGPEVSIERSPATTWSTGPVTVTITADDGGGSGVESIEYSIDGGLTYNPYTGPFPQPSTATVRARATDIAGNSGAAEPAEIRIDSSAPTVSVTASTTAWTNQPVTITLTTSDTGGSGVDPTTIEYSTNGGTSYTAYTGPFSFSTDGQTTFTARVKDVAGNTGVTGVGDTVTVKIDRVDPVVPTLSVSPSSVVLNQSVTADYACGDLLSGVASCVLAVKAPGSSTFNQVDDDGGIGILLPSGTLGSYTVRVTATDLADNDAIREATYTVLDDTPPVANLTLATDTVEMPGGNSATFSCSDSGSGIASCVMTVTSPSGSVIQTNSGSGTNVPLPVAALGTYAVRVTATDNGGIVTVNTLSYTVQDTVAPTASISVANTSVNIGATNTATFACADGGSGIQSCRVEVTAPGSAISVLLPTTGNSGTVALPVTTAGTYTVKVTATDRAGLTAMDSKTYTVGLCVIEDYDYTQAKSIGSNYTIKIRLCDANGKNISSNNIVLTAVSVTGSNGVSFPPGPNDSGQSNSGFTFRFSQKSYIYNLDTTNFPFIGTGRYTLDFTTKPVVAGSPPPPPEGRARFTLRM